MGYGVVFYVLIFSAKVIDVMALIRQLNTFFFTERWRLYLRFASLPSIGTQGSQYLYWTLNNALKTFLR